METKHQFGERVYAYARFSTKKQSLGDSERRQQENAQQWAKEYGCEVEYIIDPGISARRGKNRTIGQFGAFVARLRSGELGGSPTLLVENFDRISREDITDALPQFLELIKLGATVITLHNRMVYRHPIDLTEAMLALVEMKAASAYSANLSRRVSASWVRARRDAAKGICIHRGTCPGWLRQVGDHFEPIKERVKLVREIFRKYLDGQGTQTIAVWLNQQGIPPWTNKGQTSEGWHATTVKNLLRNRALLGEWQTHRDTQEGVRVPVGAPIEGYFPVVIEPASFYSVQGLFPTINKRGQPSRDHWNLVAGLAWSGVDGTAMWGQKHSPGRQITIRHYLKSRGSMIGLTRPSHFVVYGEFEPRLLALLEHLDERALRKRGARYEITAARKEIAKASQQVDKYRRLIQGDEDPSPTLVAELRRFEHALMMARNAEANAIARQEQAGDRDAGKLDLNCPLDRARLHSRIAQDFEKFVFDRDVVHCWFQESTRQGVDLPLNGPIVFLEPATPVAQKTA